jgi:hypothetical protein
MFPIEYLCVDKLQVDQIYQHPTHLDHVTFPNAHKSSCQNFAEIPDLMCYSNLKNLFYRILQNRLA